VRQVEERRSRRAVSESKKDKARFIDFLKGHKGLLSKRAMSYGLEKLSIEEKEYIKSS
jgi:hypothetical protein